MNLTEQRTKNLEQRLEKNLAARQKYEEAKAWHEAEYQKQKARSEQTIAILEARLAEHRRYEAMNPVQKFFYRLIHNPAWL